MTQVQREILQLVKKGEDLILRGRYDKAHESYTKALEYLPEHYLIHNALGELLFINKNYIAAAESFYLAAIDESHKINLNLLLIDKITNQKLLMKKEEILRDATQLLENYTNKSGLALFAHQYDNPIANTPRQAAINRFRNEIDPCGYCGSTEVDKDLLVEIESEIKVVGYRFLKTMNSKTEKIIRTPPS